jgi:hypothetical protein
LAALLVLGAVAAVWVDARRGRRARALTRRIDEANGPAVAKSVAGVRENGGPAHAFSGFDETVPPGTGEPHSTAPQHPIGRHARPETAGTAASGETRTLPALLVTVPPISVVQPIQPAGPAEPAGPADRVGRGDRELSTVDLVFPFTASLADCLHDELFTHRTVWS